MKTIPYASAGIVCEMWRRDTARRTALRSYEWCLAIVAAGGEVGRAQWISLRDCLRAAADRKPRCAAAMLARAADCSRRAEVAL